MVDRIVGRVVGLVVALQFGQQSGPQFGPLSETNVQKIPQISWLSLWSSGHYCPSDESGVVYGVSARTPK